MDFMADIAGMAIGLVLFRIIEFIRRWFTNLRLRAIL